MKDLLPILLLLAILMSPPFVGRLIERRKHRKPEAPKSRPQRQPHQKTAVLGHR